MNEKFTKCLITLAFLVILIGSPVVSVANAQNASAQEIYLSFRYRNLINTVVIAYYDQENDNYYLPVGELFSLLGLSHSIDYQSLSVSVNYYDPSLFYLIDLKKGFISVNDTKSSLGAEDYLIKELDYYLHISLFKKIFELNFTVDLNNLALRLETQRDLPIVKEYERSRRRQNIAGYDLRREKYDLLFDRKRKVMGGGFLDYSITGNATTNTALTSYNFNLGAEVLGGDVQGGISGSYSPDATNFVTNNLRWRYAFPRSNTLTTIQAGQSNTQSIIQRTYTGVKVTNDPIQPRIIFDEFAFDGTTVPQSEVELYINNVLIDFQEADELGNYRFLLPLTYGNSRVRLVIYRPDGSVEEVNKRIQIPYNFQPPGRTNYSLNAGIIENPLLGSQNNIGMIQSNAAIGLTDWLTTSIGGEYLEDTDLNRPLIYSTLSARIAGEYLIGFEAAPDAFYKVNSNVVYPSSASLGFRYTYFTRAGVYNQFNYDQDITGNVFLPFYIGNTPLNFRVSANRLFTSNSFNTRYRLDFSTRIKKATFRAAYIDRQLGNLEFIASPSARLISSISYNVSNIPGIPDYLRRSFLRAEMEYNPYRSQVEEIGFQISKDFLGMGRIQASFGHNFQGDYNSVSLNLTLDFNKTRSATTIRVTRNTGSFTQNFRGSVGFDSNENELLLSNRQQVGRSAATVRLYVDDNNSGAYEPGEPLVKDKAIRLGQSSDIRMNEEGVMRVTQLQAYNRINMEINKAVIQNPLLVPQKEKFSFVADPNQYKSVDIPFYVSGIIDGQVKRVVSDSVTEGVAGIRLYLIRHDGKYSKEVRTFSDGSFYTYEVPPGSYNLYIDRNQLEFLHAVSKPDTMKIKVEALAVGDFVDGLHFSIIPGATVKEDSVTVIAEAIDKKTEAAYTGGFYQIQLASYSEKENADRALKQARQSFKTSFEVLWNADNGLYAVRTAPVNDRQTALQQVFAFQNDIFPNPALVIVKKSPRVFIKPGEKVIQIGAFENETGARKFAALSAIKLGQNTIIAYDAEHKLYKVRLAAPQSHLKTVLTDVKENSFFNDAFIATKGEKEKTGRSRILQFIYQVQIEGVTAEKEPAFMESIIRGVSDTGLLRPDKNSVIFDQVYTWKEAVKLKEQLSKVSTIGRPLIILIEQEGF